MRGGSLLVLPYSFLVACLLTYFIHTLACGCGSSISTAKGNAIKLGTVIGSNLGTTYSRISVNKNGRVEIIENDRITLSWGEPAIDQASVDAKKTVFNVKRFTRGNFRNTEVKRDKRYRVPFSIVKKDGKPYFKVDTKDGETVVFSPKEIGMKDDLHIVPEDFEQRIVNHLITKSVKKLYGNDIRRTIALEKLKRESQRYYSLL